MTAFDERNSKGGIKRIQTGSFYSEAWATDLHFITLEKSEKEYSPTTLYNDYAISPVRFPWETAGNWYEGTETARRYIRTTRGADVHGLAFVRQRTTDPCGETMPYVFLGEAFYATHRGNRPMQMEWDLAHRCRRASSRRRSSRRGRGGVLSVSPRVPAEPAPLEPQSRVQVLHALRSSRERLCRVPDGHR
jgi:hypothetical protein